MVREGMRALFAATPPVRPPSVRVEDVAIPGPDGDTELVVRVYRPPGTGAVPALYWMHGGGMTIGTIDMDDALLASAVERLGLAAVSVEYRLAPEHPDPAPVEDCYMGLVWTAAHALELGIDPDRIAVGGPSAGGGLAAGTALLARDRQGPHVPSSSSSNRCSMTGPSRPRRPPTRTRSSGTATPTDTAGTPSWVTGRGRMPYRTTPPRHGNRPFRPPPGLCRRG